MELASQVGCKSSVFVHITRLTPPSLISHSATTLLIIGILISLFFLFVPHTYIGHTQATTGTEQVNQIGCTRFVFVHITRLTRPSLLSHSATTLLVIDILLSLFFLLVPHT